MSPGRVSNSTESPAGAGAQARSSSGSPHTVTRIGFTPGDAMRLCWPAHEPEGVLRALRPRAVGRCPGRAEPRATARARPRHVRDGRGSCARRGAAACGRAHRQPRRSARRELRHRRRDVVADGRADVRDPGGAARLLPAELRGAALPPRRPRAARGAAHARPAAELRHGGRLDRRAARGAAPGRALPARSEWRRQDALHGPLRPAAAGRPAPDPRRGQSASLVQGRARGDRRGAAGWPSRTGSRSSARSRRRPSWRSAPTASSARSIIRRCRRSTPRRMCS